MGARLEDLEQSLAKTIQQRDSLITKLENQEEISRNLYYERGLLKKEVEHLNQHFISKRLEIAAMCLQGLLASNGMYIDTAKIAMKYADNLIAESNEPATS